jgi:hypothetical protein
VSRAGQERLGCRRSDHDGVPVPAWALRGYPDIRDQAISIAEICLTRDEMITHAGKHLILLRCPRQPHHGRLVTLRRAPRYRVPHT